MTAAILGHCVFTHALWFGNNLMLASVYLCGWTGMLRLGCFYQSLRRWYFCLRSHFFLMQRSLCFTRVDTQGEVELFLGTMVIQANPASAPLSNPYHSVWFCSVSVVSLAWQKSSHDVVEFVTRQAATFFLLWFTRTEHTQTHTHTCRDADRVEQVLLMTEQARTDLQDTV